MPSTISLPSGGLSLSDFPVDLSKRKNKLNQAIEIIPLGNASLEQIISSIRDGVEVTVSLGKKPVIFLDKKAIPIETTYQPQSLLFKQFEDSSTLQLAASLNLKDATARAKLAKSRDIDMNDPAILALQASMAQVKEQKDANQTIVVNSRLPTSKNGRSVLDPLKNHRQGMFSNGKVNNPSNSTPGSPAMGAVTPQPAKRDAKTIKQQALKRAFIHLLAVRAVSEKYMASVLRAAPVDLAPLLDKYGKPTIDGSKYNLSDRGYKELDPWAFPYIDESDRLGVIDRAITAFDRLRIADSDPLWQKLLKKEERGKGVVLSKLSNLRNGPVERVKTPKIQVELSTEDNNNNSDRGRHLAPSDATARSKSQDTLKKSTTKSKSALDKAAEMAQTRAQKTAEAKKKESPKKVEAKKPVAKKPISKPTASSTKVKSAEFIEDSDEEIESDEIATQVSQQKNKRKAEEDLSPPSKKVDAKKLPPKPTTKPPVEKVVFKTRAPSQPEKVVKKSQDEAVTKKTQSQSEPTKKRIPESQRGVPMARNLSGKKGTSPVKPSPLGSSPPTNASDFEHEKNHKPHSTKSSSSSSSGSPLINQRRERLQEEAKRNADKQASTNNNSDRNLKRRANDLEKGNHQHGGFSSRGNSTSSSEQPSKRPRLPDSSPSNSDSEKSQKSTASSNTSPSVILSPKDLEYARTFKLQWQKYTAGLRELQALSDPPPEKVEKLQKLYAKLKEHKAVIYAWEKKEVSS